MTPPSQHDVKTEDLVIPHDVLQALVMLETAGEPSDLGPAYSVVLHWKAPRAKRKIGLGPFRPLALLAATYWPLAVWSNQTQWIQGFACACAVLSIAQFLDSLLGPLLVRSDTLQSRIRAALDKWRHLVPAMREPPP